MARWRILSYTALIGAFPCLSQVNNAAGKSWQTRGLVSALQDPVPAVREIALGQLGSDMPADFDSAILRGYIRPPHSNSTMELAIGALGRAGGESNARTLLDIIRSDSLQLRTAAWQALRLLLSSSDTVQDRSQIANDLILLLDDSSVETRRQVLDLLSVIKFKDHAHRISTYLEDPDEIVRARAADYLGAIGITIYSQRIEKIIDAYQSQVSPEALNALSKPVRTKYIAELIESVKTGKGRWGTIGNIRFAVQSLRDKQEVLPALLSLTVETQDQDALLRILDALSVIGEPQAYARIGDFLKSPVGKRLIPNLPEGAVKALASQLGELLETERADPQIRSDILARLLPEKSLAPTVARQLRDPDAGVRGRAARLLGRMKAIQYEPLVAQLLGSNHETNQPLLLALGEMGSTGYQAELFQLDDELMLFSAATRMAPLRREFALRLPTFYYKVPRGRLITQADKDRVRFYCHYLSGGDQYVAAIVQRIMLESEADIKKTESISEAREALAAFAEFLPIAKTSSIPMASDAEKQILSITEAWSGKWEQSDRGLLESLKPLLSTISRRSFQEFAATPSILNEESVKPTIAMVTAQFETGSHQQGAGILLSHANNRLYILTASHLVTRAAKHASAVQVRLKWLPGEDFPAEISKEFDSELDSVVLIVKDADKLRIPPDLPPFSSGDLAAIKRYSKVHAISFASGSPWFCQVHPLTVSSKTDRYIIFEPDRISEGSSGGGLFDEDWNLIGMIVSSSTIEAKAVRIDRLLKRFAAFHPGSH